VAAKFLLDTNVVSDLIRNPRGRVAQCIARVGENNIFTSIVVAGELRYGVLKRNSRRLSEQVELILSALEIAPLEEPVDTIYAQLRNELERRGQLIGPNDMLIAAHALAADAAMVTANEREFARISGLRAENWLA